LYALYYARDGYQGRNCCKLAALAHTAVANARATLPQRLAPAVDDGDKLPLTHEFLALKTGVRRAGVTEAAHELARQGFVSSGGGYVTVLNRKGIEKIAGGFYGAPVTEYRRLVA